MKALARFARTASYVTSLPLARLPADAEGVEMRGLSKYLPAVGLMLGALLAGLAALADMCHLNSTLSGAILAVTWLALTGGIHFDGLMDAADGIFSRQPRERMLEIMHDSRVGNFGAMAGMAVLLLKTAALASLPLAALLQSLIWVPAWARFCETAAIGIYPYMRESGMGKVWHDSTRCPADVVAAGALPAAGTFLSVYLGFGLPLMLAGLTLACGLAAAAWLARRLGGHTGDTYGAVVEIAETGAITLTAVLINIPAVWPMAVRI